MKKTTFSNIRILALCSILLLIVSCRKESPELTNPNNRYCRTYAEQFQAVWEGMDQSYMYWAEDSVDWDARYEEYRPIFAEFDTRDRNHPVTEVEYQTAWTGLFAGLRDHHLTGYFWSPDQKLLARVSPGTNDYNHAYVCQQQIAILKRRNDVSRFLSYEGSDAPHSWFCLIDGKNEGKYIAYLRFSSFNYAGQYYYDEAMAPFRAFFGYSSSDGMGENGWATNDKTEGIIIDVRENGGGSLTDLTTYMASLIQNPVQLGYTRVKEGMGRLDYSAWSPFVVSPTSRHIMKDIPIVVLADIHSASCAELTTLLIKSLPNGTFIGERTYGATGALWSNSSIMHDIFYNGCFGDEELWEIVNNGSRPTNKRNFAYYVYTSTFNMVDNEYQPIEGYGITPDIEVHHNERQLLDGTDLQLLRAIKYLRAQ